MKDLTILFQGPMVRAILAGQKTQTRRPIKPAPIARLGYLRVNLESNGKWVDGHGQPLKPPFGEVLDRLWVRETFYAWGRWETRHSAKKGRYEWHFVDLTLESGRAYAYATDHPPHDFKKGNQRGGITPTWWKRPAIFMPRQASRIGLTVTGVHVERLQDISEADALAEGIVQWGDGYGLPDGSHFHASDPRQSYFSLWEAINGPGSVEANPWLWIIEFERVKS
jgi:hypothetical protein